MLLLPEDGGPGGDGDVVGATHCLPVALVILLVFLGPRLFIPICCPSKTVPKTVRCWCGMSMVKAAAVGAIARGLPAVLPGEAWPTAAIPMDDPYCSCKLTHGCRRCDQRTVGWWSWRRSWLRPGRQPRCYDRYDRLCQLCADGHLFPAPKVEGQWRSR